MNNNIEVASLQESPIETWNREPETYQPQSISDSSHEDAREAVALFPAGRFFRFPVRVRLRISREEYDRKPFARLNTADVNPAQEQLITEIGPHLCALIENASCMDTARPLAEIFLFGDVVVDFRKMELRRSGKRVAATAQEFKTLHYFVTHPEVPISRDELLNRVWGFHHYPTTRTVDNRILQLRKKLESDPARPTHLLTVHGVGYKFVP